MYIRLSYDLEENTPYPAGLRPVHIEHDHDMTQGNISNVYTLTLCNHVGTHIDGPNHFGKNKKTLSQFDINHFVFRRPLVLDMPKGDDGLVTSNDLKVYGTSISQCDLLLIRTGFSRVRSQDRRRYTEHSPGFTVGAARFIVDECPSLSVLGMDTLSFAAPQKPEEGIRAHQIMMDQCDRNIFLIEDINLNHDLTGLKQVIVAPLFCERLDSAPCTILAEIGKPTTPGVDNQ